MGTDQRRRKYEWGQGDKAKAHLGNWLFFLRSLLGQESQAELTAENWR